MTYKIYGHKSPSNKWYIGRTCRKLEYRWNNGKGYAGCTKIMNAIKKYGWNNFEHILIAECETKEQSILVEAIFKRIYNSVDNGYNFSKELEESGIEGENNPAKRPEVRKKISEKAMGNTWGFKKGYTPWNKVKVENSIIKKIKKDSLKFKCIKELCKKYNLSRQVITRILNQ